MGRLRDLRVRARDAIQATWDGLAVLEHLFFAAFVTAMITTLAAWAVDVGQIPLPAWSSPAWGFFVASAVTFVGFWAARGHRTASVRDAVAEAGSLLDSALGLGWDPRAPTYLGTTIRTLAQATREKRLLEALDSIGGGISLAERLQERVDRFDSATTRYAGQLSPPRANVLVDKVIRFGNEAAAAARRFERAENEAMTTARYDRDQRVAQLVPSVDELGSALIATVDAAQELEELHDRKAARGDRATRASDAAGAAHARLAYQATVASAAEEFLHDLAPPFGERSTLGREAMSLRDLLEELRFAYNDDIDAEALVEWRRRIELAQMSFQSKVAGHGYVMAPGTQAGWITVNDWARQLANAIDDLRHRREGWARLSDAQRAEAGIEKTTEEARGDILERAQQLVKAADRVKALEVR